MSVFDWVSPFYDLGILPLELLFLRRLRRRLFSSLRGNVLEVGTGTGLNLPFYGSAAGVTVCDVSEEMLRHATRRRGGECAALVRADAQHLPFADGGFDAVAASLVFCSVADPARGLAEARRVLRPGGRLALLEHTRGRGLGAWLTDRLQPLWHVWSRECHLNRETERAVVEAGFEVRRVKRYALAILRLIEAAV